MAAICFICKLTEQDEVTYGEFLSKSHVSVHYFCLLLSTNLPQHGRNDESGIRRFGIKDITKLVQTISNTICSYCGKGYASVHCSKCLIAFHQICGAKQGCLYEFQDSFKAYCPAHINIREQPYSPGERCIVCEDRLPEYTVTGAVPSCCYRGWSHIQCIRRYALNAGYYLKCFLCRNTEYKTMVRSRGVYVPDRDAIWEREQNAYKELEKRNHHCDARECTSKHGRQYVTKSGRWRMLFCASCGFFGLHVPCAKSANIVLIEDTFNCDDCKTILDNTMSLTKFDMNDTLVDNPELPTLSQRSISVSDDNVMDIIDTKDRSMKSIKAHDIGTEYNENDMDYVEESENAAVPTLSLRSISVSDDNVLDIIDTEDRSMKSIAAHAIGTEYNENDMDYVEESENAAVPTLSQRSISVSDDNVLDIIDTEDRLMKSIAAHAIGTEYNENDMDYVEESGNAAAEANVVILPKNAGRTDTVRTYEATGQIYITDEDGFSETSSSLADVYSGRMVPVYELANEDTGNISREACFSDTSSSLHGGETGRLAKILAIFVEPDHKSISVDDNETVCPMTSTHVMDFTNRSYEVAKAIEKWLSIPSECLVNCISDTSSSLGDGESKRPVPKKTRQTANEANLSCIVTGSSSNQIVTEGDLNFPSQKKKILDGRILFGGSQDELYARRMESFWKTFEYTRNANAEADMRECEILCGHFLDKETD